MRGEGIFLQLKEDVVEGWVRSAPVAERGRAFLEAHRRWRAARNLQPPDAGFSGMRYVLLHTLAHVLMRQLALESGYAMASIRERIYSLPPTDEDGPMAGVLLYTAATDSEGTLGGLVGLGEPAELGRHLAQALERASLCTSDPWCAEHHPYRDGTTLHGAACHACLFAPETSCERGNKYLDRNVLTATLCQTDLAFLSGGA